jgi:hypothetical protein
VLVRLGYPPVVIFKRQRDAYLTAMRRADSGDYKALGELIARAMYDNLVRFIVTNVAGPARMVPLAALVDKEFTLVALRRAAQRGRLDAVQGSDGVWRSSRRAVDAYRWRSISGNRGLLHLPNRCTAPLDHPGPIPTPGSQSPPAQAGEAST